MLSGYASEFRRRLLLLGQVLGINCEVQEHWKVIRIKLRKFVRLEICRPVVSKDDIQDIMHNACLEGLLERRHVRLDGSLQCLLHSFFLTRLDHQRMKAPILRGRGIKYKGRSQRKKEWDGNLPVANYSKMYFDELSKKTFKMMKNFARFRLAR